MNNQNRRDPFLIAVVLALLVLGLVMVQSASGPVATERAGDAFYYVKRQMVGVLIGGAGCLALAWTPYNWFQRYTWYIYGAALVGLLLVFVPGISHSANGATRWIGVGGFQEDEEERKRKQEAMEARLR